MNENLPPTEPCTDPRHTGRIREQLGCAGPDPAEQPAVGTCGRALSTGEPCPDHPADREQPRPHPDHVAVLDGRDALAFVIIRPSTTDPDNVDVEASARGMGKAAAAYALRMTADQFDKHARAEGDEPIPYPAAAPAADWVADVRAAIAFNLPEREPALETLRDVLLDTAPRTPEQALAAARLILAQHTREHADAVRKYVKDYSDEHGVNRSTRGLITGMGVIRRLLDQRADAEAQQ